MCEEAARIERERVAELERMAAQEATELDKAKLLGPILDLEAIRDPQGIENRIPVAANGVTREEAAPAVCRTRRTEACMLQKMAASDAPRLARPRRSEGHGQPADVPSGPGPSVPG
jgi:hypothetical protein